MLWRCLFPFSSYFNFSFTVFSVCFLKCWQYFVRYNFCRFRNDFIDMELPLLRVTGGCMSIEILFNLQLSFEFNLEQKLKLCSHATALALLVSYGIRPSAHTARVTWYIVNQNFGWQGNELNNIITRTIYMTSFIELLRNTNLFACMDIKATQQLPTNVFLTS